MNQRPIKFRAWDRGKKAMFYGVEKLYDGYGQITDREGNAMDIRESTGQGSKSFGQILRGEGEYYTQNVSVVHWNDCYFMTDGIDGWWTKTLDTLSHELLRSSASKEICEVIGNIHENPELLESDSK